MAHRHVGAATSLCHIPLRPSLCCISLPYPSAASCGCSKARLSAGSWGHGPCPQRLTGCLPHASRCGLRVAVALAASWKAWSRTNLRLLRLSGCRINLRSRLASPARFNLHGHSSRLALPLSFVPWPRKHPPVWRVCGMRLLLGFAAHCHGAARLPCLPRAACHRQLCPAFFAPSLRGRKQATRAQSRRRCTPLASILACAD